MMMMCVLAESYRPNTRCYVYEASISPFLCVSSFNTRFTLHFALAQYKWKIGIQGCSSLIFEDHNVIDQEEWFMDGEYPLCQECNYGGALMNIELHLTTVDLIEYIEGVRCFTLSIGIIHTYGYWRIRCFRYSSIHSPIPVKLQFISTTCQSHIGNMNYLEKSTPVSHFDPTTARQIKLLQVRASVNNWEQPATYKASQYIPREVSSHARQTCQFSACEFEYDER